MTEWKALREELAHIVFRRGVTSVSHLIPAGRTTVYRLISEDVRPCRAIKAGVERLVASERSSQVEQGGKPSE